DEQCLSHYAAPGVSAPPSVLPRRQCRDSGRRRGALQPGSQSGTERGPAAATGGVFEDVVNRADRADRADKTDKTDETKRLTALSALSATGTTQDSLDAAAPP